MEIKREYLEWMNGGDSGISSKTLMNVFTDVPVREIDIPYDMADVGRCIRMLRRFPELRGRLSEVISKYPFWMPFIDCWKELEMIYDECIKFESLPINEQNKLKKRKHYYNCHQQGWEIIKQMVFASRYIKGLRCQNSTNSWWNIPPKEF